MTTQHFEITVRETPGGMLHVCLAGDFDMGVGNALADALAAAAARSGVRGVQVDLSRTTFLDSHGIAGLVAGYEAAHRAGHRLTVVNCHGLVRDVLRVTGLLEVLTGSAEPAAG
ncbi:MAG TPA: STAS domain-containing protein [Actinoplanes sp.]